MTLSCFLLRFIIDNKVDQDTVILYKAMSYHFRIPNYSNLNDNKIVAANIMNLFFAHNIEVTIVNIIANAQLQHLSYSFINFAETFTHVSPKYLPILNIALWIMATF